jgi:hypothetical protein
MEYWKVSLLRKSILLIGMPNPCPDLGFLVTQDLVCVSDLGTQLHHNAIWYLMEAANVSSYTE